MSEVIIMPVHSRLKVLIAAENLRRAQGSKPPLTVRQLSAESGVAVSVITGLTTDKAQRIDYKTIDRLCAYFNVGVGDLLVRDQEEQETP
ncbi:MAG: helix-turn-helix domain-containing protein [Roseiflexaceae bacterium]